jgi:hypothetical protein
MCDRSHEVCKLSQAAIKLKPHEQLGSLFRPAFSGEALSAEFYPPQDPGVAYTLSQVALNAVQHRLAKPYRELDGYGDMMLTYKHNLPWVKGVEGGVDGRIVCDLPRIDIVFLYDLLAAQDEVNELVVSVGTSKDTINLQGTQYQLAPRGSLLEARADIAAAAQKFFDRANRDV